MNYHYEVYEDVIGGLSLFLLNEKEEPLWGGYGYEKSEEGTSYLKKILDMIAKETDFEKLKSYGFRCGILESYGFPEWSKNLTIQNLYEETMVALKNKQTQLIIDQHGIYKDRMGCSGRFLYGSCNEKEEESEEQKELLDY